MLRRRLSENDLLLQRRRRLRHDCGAHDGHGGRGRHVTTICHDYCRIRHRNRSRRYSRRCDCPRGRRRRRGRNDMRFRLGATTGQKETKDAAKSEYGRELLYCSGRARTQRGIWNRVSHVFRVLLRRIQCYGVFSPRIRGAQFSSRSCILKTRWTFPCEASARLRPGAIDVDSRDLSDPSGRSCRPSDRTPLPYSILRRLNTGTLAKSKIKAKAAAAMEMPPTIDIGIEVMAIPHVASVEAIKRSTFR